MRTTIAATAAALILGVGLASPAAAVTSTHLPEPTQCYDGKGKIEPCYDVLYQQYIDANATVGEQAALLQAQAATIAAQRATIVHQRQVIKRLRHRLAVR